jgi:hypothetical protein
MINVARKVNSDNNLKGVSILIGLLLMSSMPFGMLY